jgi:hypothetical protein
MACADRESQPAARKRILNVKTVRFAKVVERSGAPETRLVLIDPAEDRALQSAVKAERVMTLFQESVGTKTDRGEIGFEPGPGRQFLVFPKSLKPFAGRPVVGIKYILSSPEVAKSQWAEAPRTPKKPKLKPAAKTREEKTEPPKHNVLAFKRPSEAESEEEDNEEVADLKNRCDMP